MADTTTLARPYAVAVYKRAKETGSTDQWSGQLQFLAAVMSDPRMRQAATNPKAQREAFAAAFLELCCGQLDGEGENFVKLLIENHRLLLVGTIAEQFAAYRAEDEGVVEVQVHSAYWLSDEEFSLLNATLARVLGKTPKITVFLDENLIGGVFIRAGDRVIDASVRGQIERLAKRLCN